MERVRICVIGAGNFADYAYGPSLRLLAETDAPIASIAGELGYANPSGLYKQFSRAYGMTPRAYRACCGERAVPGDRARG